MVGQPVCTLPPNCSDRNGQHPQQAPGDPADPASACNFCLAGHHCCLSKHLESIIRSSRRLMAGTRKSVGCRWLWQGLNLTRGGRGQSFHTILCNNKTFYTATFLHSPKKQCNCLDLSGLFFFFLFSYSITAKHKTLPGTHSEKGSDDLIWNLHKKKPTTRRQAGIEFISKPSLVFLFLLPFSTEPHFFSQLFSQWAFDSHCLIDFHSLFTLLYSLTLILSPTQTLNFDLSLYMTASTPKPSSWTLTLRVVRKKVMTRKNVLGRNAQSAFVENSCAHKVIFQKEHTHIHARTRVCTHIDI